MHQTSEKPVYKNLLVLLAMVLPLFMMAQIKQGLVANFSFNDSKDYDEVTKRKAKLVGVNFTEDRFGNVNNAVSLAGNLYSYINLGNYPALKQKTATIALWANVENITWSGKGYRVNPILLTKSRKEDDFFEAYSLMYTIEGDRVEACCARDSVRQIPNKSLEKFRRRTWHHLAISYNDSFMSFYVDGALQRKAIKNFETKFLASDSVLIGSTGNKKNERFFDGEIDDIVFYNRVLSDEEIRILYHAANPNKYSILLNWALIIFSFIAGILLIYFFIRYQVNLTVKKERQRLELDNIILETELRVNRALMNPHFVFNSLNALQNFILKNENDRANNYLVKFSKLMRKILENNMSDTIPLEMEIDLLQKYLEIEDLRFEENIIHTVFVDPKVKPSGIKIPIMMLQPFIENAVWHGLLKKTGVKTLSISFFLYGSDYIECVIEDNGVGRRTNEDYSLEKKSLGISFVEQRLKLFNKIHGLTCSLVIVDKPENSGTIVKIVLPILNK